MSEQNAEKKRIYLDYNATAPISNEVKEVFVQALDSYANASSLHEDGRSVAKKIEKAREQVAHLINAHSPDEIIFTSGGSESNNTVLNSMLSESKKRNRKLIAISAIEHPCVLESAKHLTDFGLTVKSIPVDSFGVIDMNAYKSILAEKPLLVSIMAANNEIGTIQDIKLLTSLAHKELSLFHTDAVQAAGKMPVDVQEWNVDYATFSGHKIYAPKGVGALYVKKGSPYDTFMQGGHQENGKRAGTYNAPSIIAYGKAAEEAERDLKYYESHTRSLRNALRDGLIRLIPNIRINGHPEKVLPNTLDVSFPGAEGEAILLYLDLLGISVSTGSACASGSLEPSHVLMATGIGSEAAHGSIRFSFGKYSTQKDVDYILAEFPHVIDKLRKMSTLKNA